MFLSFTLFFLQNGTILSNNADINLGKLLKLLSHKHPLWHERGSSGGVLWCSGLVCQNAQLDYDLRNLEVRGNCSRLFVVFLRDL